MSDAPTDPIGKVAAAAVSLHELFTSLCAAGFTQAQAMELVKTILIKKAG
ncbi:hypothetical protein [Streptomyces sp. NPDC048188]